MVGSDNSTKTYVPKIQWKISFRMLLIILVLFLFTFFVNLVCVCLRQVALQKVFTWRRKMNEGATHNFFLHRYIYACHFTRKFLASSPKCGLSPILFLLSTTAGGFQDGCRRDRRKQPSNSVVGRLSRRRRVSRRMRTVHCSSKANVRA